MALLPGSGVLWKQSRFILTWSSAGIRPVRIAEWGARVRPYGR
jgi:hypothetical protein